MGWEGWWEEEVMDGDGIFEFSEGGQLGCNWWVVFFFKACFFVVSRRDGEIWMVFFFGGDGAVDFLLSQKIEMSFWGGMFFF